MSDKVHVSVSMGEFWDKLSILQIKKQEIRDETKQRYITEELAALHTSVPYDELLEKDRKLAYLYRLLKHVNRVCWFQMEKLRPDAVVSDAQSFVALTRECLQINDERARIKRKIDQHLNSALREQKSYNEKQCFFLGHLGLGDQFTCNAIVRFLTTIYDRVYVVYKKSAATMDQMYQDDPSVVLVYVTCDTKISPHFQYSTDKLLSEWRDEKHCELVLLGLHSHSNIMGPKHHKTFDLHPQPLLSQTTSNTTTTASFFEQWFKTMHLSYESDRWLYQFAPRNMDRELAFYKVHKSNDEQPYLFYHDDPQRSIRIPQEALTATKLNIVDAGQRSNNLFDYGILIERAQELHLIDSSFLCLLLFLDWQHASWRRVVIYRRQNMGNYDLLRYIPAELRTLITIVLL